MTMQGQLYSILKVIDDNAFTDDDWRSLLKHILRCKGVRAEASRCLSGLLLGGCHDWVGFAMDALHDLEGRNEITAENAGFEDGFRDAVRRVSDPMVKLEPDLVTDVDELLGPGGIVDEAFAADPTELTESRGLLLLQRCLRELAVVRPLENAFAKCRTYGTAPANLVAILDEAAARCRSVDAIAAPAVRTLAEEWKEHWARLRCFRGRTMIGLKTGQPELDRRTLGLRGLVILGAKPGAGKSTYACVELAVGVCRHHSANKAVVVIISLDMDRFELYRRIHCHLADLDWRSLAQGSPKDTREPGKGYSAEHKACLDRAKRRLDSEQIGSRLVVLDRSHLGDNITAGRLSAVVDALKAKHGATRALLIVDYLQLLPVPEENTKGGDLAADRYRVRVVQEFIEASRSESNPLGDTALVISEARKPPKAQEIWGDSMSELMGSARIGYAADAVILYREMTPKEMQEYYRLGDKAAADRRREALRDEGVVPVMLILDKGRDGMTRGKWPVEFHYRKSIFHEIDLSKARLARIPGVDANQVNGDGDSPAGQADSAIRHPIPLPPIAPGTRATKKRNGVDSPSKSGKTSRSGKKSASTHKQRSKKK